MIRSAFKTSRRWRTCESCRHYIRPGQRYYSSVASPGHGDLGNEHWWRLNSCADCAERYGWATP